MSNYHPEPVFPSHHRNLYPSASISVEQGDFEEFALLNISLRDWPSDCSSVSVGLPTLTVGSAYFGGEWIGILALSWSNDTYYFLVDTNNQYIKLAVSKWISDGMAALAVNVSWEEFSLNAKVHIADGAKQWLLSKDTRNFLFPNPLSNDTIRLGAISTVLAATLASEENGNLDHSLLQKLVARYAVSNSTSDVIKDFYAGLKDIEGTSEASRVRSYASYISRGSFSELRRVVNIQYDVLKNLHEKLDETTDRLKLFSKGAIPGLDENEMTSVEDLIRDSRTVSRSTWDARMALGEHPKFGLSF